MCVTPGSPDDAANAGRYTFPSLREIWSNVFEYSQEERAFVLEKKSVRYQKKK